MKKKRERIQSYPTEPNDWYVEPDWVSERLFALEEFKGSLWDPWAGSGRIIRVAQQHKIEAYGTDILDRGFKPELVERFDFFKANPKELGVLPENLVGHPPHKRLDEAVRLALTLATHKVALMLPFRWTVDVAHSAWLEENPPARVLMITPRPWVVAGQVAFKKPDEWLTPSAALLKMKPPANGNSDFAWFVWEIGHKGRPELGWCRRGDAGGASQN